MRIEGFPVTSLFQYVNDKEIHEDINAYHNLQTRFYFLLSDVFNLTLKTEEELSHH